MAALINLSKLRGDAKTPGVVYAISTSLGGVGLAEVAGRAVEATYAAGLLMQAIAFRSRLESLPRSMVTTVRFQPAKLFSWLPAQYYYSMKRATLDRAARRYVRRHSPALVHGWTNECLVTLQAAREAEAIVVLERNLCHPLHSRSILRAEYASRGIDWPPSPYPWFKRFDHWHREQTLALQECDLADYILVPSTFAYETFRTRGYPEDKLVLIPRGADVERFQPGASPPGLFRVLFVGQVCFRKGVPYLLEAWDRLQLPRAELVLAGSVHEEMRPILSRYAHLTNLRVVGFTDPAPLLADSTVFCFPSLHEGSAKVTYEALAAGLPLIVTPEAGSVVRDGQEGLLIPPREVEPLMAALEHLYAHPAQVKEMALLARQRAQEFTWEDYARRLVEFYRRALTKPGGQG